MYELPAQIDCGLLVVVAPNKSETFIEVSVDAQSPVTTTL